MVCVPDSVKQYNITDNVGTIRSVYTYDMRGDSRLKLETYDYKPFGDSLSTDKSPVGLGYGGGERDGGKLKNRELSPTYPMFSSFSEGVKDRRIKLLT